MRLRSGNQLPDVLSRSLWSSAPAAPAWGPDSEPAWHEIGETFMEYVVGVALAFAVAVFAAKAGFDRDRAFYPTVLVVVASYYDLFAVVGGSMPALAIESVSLAAFAGVAIIGFRSNLWLVVVALFAHGALDLGHGRLVANPGVPSWWPMFCLAFDWMAAATLAWRLAKPSLSIAAHAAPEGFQRRIRPHVNAELTAALSAEQSGNWAASFRRLERAHVLGQASTIEHVRVHARMLAWATRHRDAREILAQLLRIAGAATKTLFGLVPSGNTGGGNVGAFRALPIPLDLAPALAAAHPPTLGRGVGLVLALGFLFAFGLSTGAVIAAPADVRIASIEGRSLAYRVLGAGRPVIVMVSGLGDGMESFKDVAPVFAKGATVIVYDRAGYGLSPAATGPADAKAAARDLEAVLAQSGVRGPYILVGHSLGGLIVEYYAALHPTQVAGLVLEESRPADFTRRCEAANIPMCAPTAAMVRTAPKGVQDEVAALPSIVAQVEAAGPFRGKAVLVVSRPFGPKPSPFEALWSIAQADLAGRYALASHLTAPGGGHYIHRDARDWFVGAVQQYVGVVGDRP
jgi:pimeloyl-ACP methyl ester carboxylesterase